MSSPPQSPPKKKLKHAAENADEETQNRETPMHIISRETQNSETQNTEAQNSETQNRETPMHIISREARNRGIPMHIILSVLSETQNREIPEHVILNEILPRLPADSLLRFKRVCKEWELLISSSDFINDHAFRPNPLSSRVFNPVVGGLGITISPPRNFLRSTHYAKKDYSFGFGYSSTHKEFYIVAINFLVSLNLPVVVVFVYNCSTERWAVKHSKPTAAPKNEGQRLSIVLEDVWYKHCGTLVNEALHWGATVIGMNVQCIVGFDLVSKKLKFMNLPYVQFGEPAFYMRSAFSLCCLNDCLCAWAYYDGGSRVDLWMMKEYSVRKSWTRLFCADMKATFWYFFGLTKPREVMMFDFGRLRYLDFSSITPIWRDFFFSRPSESSELCSKPFITSCNNQIW